MRTFYTAVATASDEGRNGRSWTPGHALDFKMAMPESMGGPGGEGTNPEELFACGYAACFANAMRSVARREHREEVVDGATVTAHVDIGRGEGGLLQLAVRLEATVPQLSQEEAEQLMAKADQRCPYSNATRGNVPVELVVLQPA